MWNQCGQDCFLPHRGYSQTSCYLLPWVEIAGSLSSLVMLQKMLKCYKVTSISAFCFPECVWDSSCFVELACRKTSFHIWEGFFLTTTFLDHIIELGQISGSGRRQLLAKDFIWNSVFWQELCIPSLTVQVCRMVKMEIALVIFGHFAFVLPAPVQCINSLLWFSQVFRVCPQRMDQGCVQPWNTWTWERELQFS